MRCIAPSPPRRHNVQHAHDAARRPLSNLPYELLSVIATSLSTPDVVNFHSTDRRTAWATENVWAERQFSARTCRTSPTSLAHLRQLALSRHAKKIRNISVQIHLEYNLNSPFAQYQLRAYADMVRMDLRVILGQAVRLQQLNLVAPSAPYVPPPEISPLVHLPYGYHNDNMLLSDHGAEPLEFWAFISEVFQELIVSGKGIETFRLLGFAKAEWLVQIFPTPSLLVDLSNSAIARSLTTLTLEVVLHSHLTDSNILSVAKLISSNSNLQHLTLNVGLPSLSFTFPNENWSSLLDTLYKDPVFSLQTLEFSGLATCSSSTLDQIVRTHSKSLRRLVLERTNFRAPNFLRPLFSSLAASRIEYFAFRELWLHNRTWIVSSRLSYAHLPDLVLEFTKDAESGRKDKSYRGWVDIVWPVSPRDAWIQWDNTDGKLGDEGMKRGLLEVVEAIDCGSIVDS
ncbi:hypothetical protein ACN47E_004406 [Coniothyrium glycines]